MRALRRLAGWLVALGTAAALVLIAFGGMRSRPEDWPWSPLDLSRPIGAATGRKLAALAGQGPRCLALLSAAGVRARALPTVRAGACGYADAVRLEPGGAADIALAPAGVVMSCPVAAALALWEWDVLQPAAEARLGTRVVAVEHVGTYSCRPIVGAGATTALSEHAHANAIDITGFRLADGRRVTVARDWHGTGAKATFLREVRDGACRVYATVLSPDYNAAHRTHLHLDQAARGAWGWRACN